MDRKKKDKTGLNLTEKFWPHLILFGACFLVYFQSIGFEFSPQNEQWIFLHNKDFYAHFLNIFSLFAEPALGFWRPFFAATFMFDLLIGSGSPTAFHLMNVFFHALACNLFFVLLVKLNSPRTLALMLSLIFAVHPANAAAVAWVPGRNDTLLTIFFLGAFIAFLNFIQTKQRKQLFFSAFLIIAALLTKENAIVIPFILFIYWYYVSGRKERSILSFFWGTLVITIIAWIFVHGQIVRLHIPVESGSFFISLKDMILAMCMNAGKLILPIHQSVGPTVTDTPLIPYFIAISCIGAAVWKFRFVNQKLAFVGLAWFAAMLLIPVVFSSLSGNKEHGEQRLYASGIGFLIFLSQIHFSKSKIVQDKNLALYSGFVLIAVFSYLTISRAQVYRNSFEMIKAGTIESPHNVYFFEALGDYFASQKIMTDAITNYTIALSLSPDKASLYSNRGAAYAMMDKHLEALSDLNQALKLNPASSPLLQNRAALFLRLNKPDSALVDLKTLKMLGYENAINPGLEKDIEAEKEIQLLTEQMNSGMRTDTLLNLRGVSLYSLRRFREAIDDFTEATRISPDNLKFFANRAMTYEAIGIADSAYYDYKKIKEAGYKINPALLERLRKEVEGRRSVKRSQ